MNRPLPHQLRLAVEYLHGVPGMHPLLISAVHEAAERIEADHDYIVRLEATLSDILDIALSSINISARSAHVEDRILARIASCPLRTWDKETRV